MISLRMTRPIPTSQHSPHPSAWGSPTASVAHEAAAEVLIATTCSQLNWHFYNSILNYKGLSQFYNLQVIPCFTSKWAIPVARARSSGRKQRWTNKGERSYGCHSRHGSAVTLAMCSPSRKRDSKSLATGAAGEARRGKGGEERKRRRAKAPIQLRQSFLSTCLKLPVNSGDQSQAWAGPRDNTLFRLTTKPAEASNKCTWVPLGRT